MLFNAIKLKSKRNSIVSGIGNRAIDLIEETENINIGQNIKLDIKLSNNENLKFEVPAKSRF